MKKINIKISITALFLLGVVGIVNINCSDDVLNQTNPNKLSPDTFWQTEGDAEKGVIGAYSPFTHIWYYTRFEIFASDYRDDLINGFNTSERTAAGYFSATSDSNAARWVWQAMYQGVARANEVLRHVPEIEMDASYRDNIVGEAYFIRAFNYFNLLNSWRNIPLITVPSAEVDLFTVVQAAPEEVWAQIESDLQMAKSMLPASWSSDQLGRATSGAAAGYLGKAYLYQGKWAEAKAEFQSVMTSGTYQLMDDYAHNFTEEFENNAESLWEIQLVADGLTGWGADAPNRGKGAGYQPDLAPKGYTNQNGMRINDWALNLFLDEQTINGEIDPRAYTTLFWDTDETTDYEGKTLASRTYENATYDEAYPAGDGNIYANKFLDWEFNGHAHSQDQGGWHGAGNNLRLLRYADVLLMFAEAEFNLNGSTSAALDAINQVRARADMPAHASITMQDIEDERIKELSFERSRYFDLLRWGRVKSRIVDNPDLKSESAGTAAYKPGREYIAIPQNDVDRNPNLNQNPGY
ncbi:RagB/SusD family nutrient uptake outer membrane protein [Seonamhaeicola maritimus]|uniref:RagB/SusD family nutrient uptake outer membrane protein n=1 Tax=Seonamhaeicola maritimus TaxID=2591822 RepID=A0A5C7GK47_9FLAO|nr:RagB/SusD family nutrient uptake outer membrane protein [Seonamhaeicola maritimus]TXG38642.1 RagB/SusD family nutrient uptake outer membrane protein [Seonamhaeicola maritimus]